MNEIDQLAEILTEDYYCLAEKGDSVDEGFETVDVIEGDEGRWMRHMQVITQGPSGQHYRWAWERGLTEYQECEGPAEYGKPVITPVRKVAVEAFEWVPDDVLGSAA